MIKQCSRSELTSAGYKFGKATITATEYIKGKAYWFTISTKCDYNLGILCKESVDKLVELLGLSDVSELNKLEVRDAYFFNEKAFNYKRRGVWALIQRDYKENS